MYCTNLLHKYIASIDAIYWSIVLIDAIDICVDLCNSSMINWCNTSIYCINPCNRSIYCINRCNTSVHQSMQYIYVSINVLCRLMQEIYAIHLWSIDTIHQSIESIDTINRFITLIDAIDLCINWCNISMNWSMYFIVRYNISIYRLMQYIYAPNDVLHQLM